MRLPRSLALLLLALACSESGPDGRALDAEAVAANNRGVGLMGHFDYEGAHAAFAALARERPDWLDVRVNLAIATLNRQRAGDAEAALAILDHVLDVDPDHLRAHYMAGLCRIFLGELSRAERHFRAVEASDPEDAYASYYLGQALAQRGQAEEALASYRRALENDPLLRSAHFGAWQALRKLGRSEQAAEHLRDFERLERNPQARLAEFKYTRMGPMGMAVTVDLEDPAPIAPPTGPAFAAAEIVRAAGLAGASREAAAARPAGLTAADLSGDGAVDLFVAAAEADGAPNAVLVGTPEGFESRTAHPLAGSHGVHSALWGDFDNDGLTDAYLLRRGANQLWRQAPAGSWIDVTAAAEASGGERDTTDGAMFDADHDGDLDLFLVNADGPNELLNNDGDGSFRPIAAERGIDGGARPSRAILPVDLDRDRDLDLLVIHGEPPHQVFRNDLLWEYHGAKGFESLSAASIGAALAADLDSDGAVEIYTLSDSGELRAWRADETGVWRAATLHTAAVTSAAPQLAIADVTGDGRLEILRSEGTAWSAIAGAPDRSEVIFRAASPSAVVGFAPTLVEPERGPAVAAVLADGSLALWRAGPGRHAFLAVAFSGREDRAESMRSNASGIGTRAAFRVGSRWTVAETTRRHSGPGQGLQPLAVGLAGRERADFLAIDWSDGVFQSELSLEAGRLHRIGETQRQLSSCPLLFAWDGEEYAFVSDVLGVGGIGMLIEPGAWSVPRPFESYLLPDSLLQPSGGRYRLKIAQMMEEVAYLDAAELVAYDLPPGWQLTLDERMGMAAPDPTGLPRFYREEIHPERAIDARGRDVTARVREADGSAASPGPLDERFIGLLAGEQLIELVFPRDLDSAPGEPLLVIDGWIEYPYAQTVFAAWQAGLHYQPLSVDARAPGEPWQVVLDRFGYPAGMPRNMSVPLSGLPAGARELRIRTNQEIYLDRLFVALAREDHRIRRHALPLVDARVAKVGFSARQLHPQRRPHYSYATRVPFWDTRHPRGWYTSTGPVLELVQHPDDALAIVGPGEEVHLEFEQGLAELAPGWTRRIVLNAQGFAKDMDLYTRDGGRVGPLPSAGHPPEVRDALHARYNLRYEAGR